MFSVISVSFPSATCYVWNELLKSLKFLLQYVMCCLQKVTRLQQVLTATDWQNCVRLESSFSATSLQQHH